MGCAHNKRLELSIGCHAPGRTGAREVRASSARQGRATAPAAQAFVRRRRS
jgi:hypothetical protein